MEYKSAQTLKLTVKDFYERKTKNIQNRADITKLSLKMKSVLISQSALNAQTPSSSFSFRNCSNQAKCMVHFRVLF